MPTLREVPTIQGLHVVNSIHHVAKKKEVITPDVDEVWRNDEEDQNMLDPVDNDLSWKL